MNTVPPTPSLPYPHSQNNLQALGAFDQDLVRALFRILTDMATRLNAAMPKDGTEPMTGDLNLAGFDITNVSDLTVSFTITAGSISAQQITLPSYTVAGLPTATAGRIAFAVDGRKNGEGAGLGTGVLVFADGTAWRASDTGATVSA